MIIASVVEIIMAITRNIQEMNKDRGIRVAWRIYRNLPGKRDNRFPRQEIGTGNSIQKLLPRRAMK